MPKRSDSADTVLLALEVLRRIPRGRKISAPELHQQLADAGIHRDLRTIQRQLEMLVERFDIERDERSRPYGYRWKEKARALSLPTLTAQESLLLKLAEQHLRNILPANLMKSMAPYFSQARTNLLTTTSARREHNWLSKVRVVSTTQPLLPPEIRAGVLEEVSNALYSDHWLAIEYRNASGKVLKAEVMPLGLAQQGPRLYLVCRFSGYENERSLALHRFVSARAETLAFQRPRDFDLEKFDDAGRFGIGEGKRIRISFRIKKPVGLHLLESPLSADQQVKEMDEYYEITATVMETIQLERWLNSFGDEVSHVRRVDAVPIN